MDKKQLEIPVDSGGVDPSSSRTVSCHVRDLDFDKEPFYRPLLLCVPASLTYICDAYFFVVGLVVLPALNRVAFISVSTLLNFLSSLAWFAIICGIALFPGVINPHDVGYFYVIQYVKFCFVWWRYISQNIFPYISLPSSTPVQHHIVNPLLKMLFVLSFTLCTQNMYSQLLKCHKIPPHQRKAFRVFEAVMSDVKFMYGIILGRFGSFLCRAEHHIRDISNRSFQFAFIARSGTILALLSMNSISASSPVPHQFAASSLTSRHDDLLSQECIDSRQDFNVAHSGLTDDKSVGDAKF